MCVCVCVCVCVTGPGLVFVVYPQALAKMPYANVWAVLFFSLMLVLGVDSQFATVEVSALNDSGSAQPLGENI